MVHGTREHSLVFLLLAAAMTMSAVSTASAATTTLAAALATLSTLSCRTSGRTPASPASPAFTASGPTGGVIRSNIHATLFFVLYPYPGEQIFRNSVSLYRFESQLVARFPGRKVGHLAGFS
jgi:hypothetical protein